jgi:16S rRNA (uracil1498-N3)-methyltransferase
VNLILIESNELRASGGVRLSDARATHLVNVLRVTKGTTVRVGMLDGPCGAGVVRAIGDGTVDLECQFETRLPERPRVDLLLALPRPKVLRRLWAQLAALGQIILTNAERVERNYFDTHILAPACYRPLLIEGLQQARDTRLPPVSVHRQFRILVEDDLAGLFPSGRRLLADPAADRQPAVVMEQQAAERTLLAVGPEGGWNDFEVGLLEAHGFQAVGIGRRTLRTDTACIALLAVVHQGMRARQ